MPDSHYDLIGPDAPATPLISVVIACYDQADVLPLTLDSFLSQSLDPDLYEIIVVDDASPTHKARAVVGQMRQAYPKAHLLYLRQSRVNEGTYGASAVVKNIGLRLAIGKYVYFNNAEICQAGQTLSHIAQVMESSPEPLCLRGRVIDLPHGEIAGLDACGRDRLHDQTDRARERVASADHAGLAVVERTRLLAVGGNDERFDYWGKEDLDLAARLKRAGVHYLYDEDLKSFHVSHPPNHVKRGGYNRMCALLEENNARGRVEANQGRSWGALMPPRDEDLDATLFVEAGDDMTRLGEQLELLVFGEGAERLEIVVLCENRNRPAVEALIEQWFRGLTLYVLPDMPEAGVLSAILECTRASYVVFSPAGAPPWRFHCPQPASFPPGLTIFAKVEALPGKNAKPFEKTFLPWGIARSEAVTIFERADGLAHLSNCFSWGNFVEAWASTHFTSSRQDGTAPFSVSGDGCDPLGKVTAVIPYFACGAWLDQCLRSMARQTRPLNAIVVIADGTSDLPRDIVDRYPQVTLLQADERSGPYRLIQTFIDGDDSAWYLFQDADDWSSVDRLERLITEAQAAGADLVGSQELRVFEDGTGCMPVAYPLDVNDALRNGPGHPLLHPTSLASRRLIDRVGGFATGLRFGGDTEFLLRAAFVGRVVNIPRACYFRRHRDGSLTTARETGLDSPDRIRLTEGMKARARANQAAFDQGKRPDLAPISRASPVRLTHVVGPSVGRWSPCHA